MVDTNLIERYALFRPLPDDEDEEYKQITARYSKWVYYVSSYVGGGNIVIAVPSAKMYVRLNLFDRPKRIKN